MGLIAGRLHRGMTPELVLMTLVNTSGKPCAHQWTSNDLAEELELPYWRIHSALKQLRRHGYVAPSAGWGRPVCATDRGCRAMMRHISRCRLKPAPARAI